MNEYFLELDRVSVSFPVRKGFLFSRVKGEVKAVDDVSFGVRRGETLGLVGESGCGKTTLARAIMRLVNPTRGSIHFDGIDLACASKRELRLMRPRFQMIFQDPYASLNPRMTVFDCLAEPLLAHRRVLRAKVAERVSSLMERVGLPPRFMRKYPHEFSGGQRQRIAIARALALDPELVIADEPVSALDVSVQAQILNLMSDLQAERGLTMIFVSHDLAVVRRLSDEVAVMYLGKIVEIGDAESIFANPMHPYAQALLSAAPRPDPDFEKARERAPIIGEPPSPLNPPTGCPFHPRCPIADARCAQRFPEWIGNATHKAACIKASP
jgi:oligopeptide transport system ATP-binding protein